MDSSPTTTTTMPSNAQPRSGRQNAPSGGKKRLPACDACKLRRVKCDPVLPPDSCSRCISKGITCTTIPVKRKSRTGIRIEAARAAFGTRPGHETNPAPLIRAESSMVQLELSGELTVHLLEINAFLTDGNLIAGSPLIPQFEASGRRFSVLPRTTRTLILCILAISARISSHPLLFGSSAVPPRLATIIVDTSAVNKSNIPEWGRRRETACQRLRELAVENAWDAKLIRGDGDTSEEALSVCLLLGVIENRHEQGKGQLWTAAFVSHLRRKIEAKRKTECAPSPAALVTSSSGAGHSTSDVFVTSTYSSVLAPDKLFNRASSSVSDLNWSTHVMREALSSAARGQLCAYTLYDEELLAGPRPTDIENVLAHSDTFGLAYSPYPRQFLEGERVRAEWWDFDAYYAIIRPFTYRMTEFALKSYEWSLRRIHHMPFNIKLFEEHIDSLATLQKLVTVAGNRLRTLLSPKAVDMRRQAGNDSSSSQWPPSERESDYAGSPTSHDGMNVQGLRSSEGVHSPMDELRAQEAARSLHLLLRGCMGAGLFPIFNDLSERIQAIDSGYGCLGDNRGVLGYLLSRVRKILLPQVLSMLRSISNTVHLAWVTSIGRSLRSSAALSGSSECSASSSPEVEAHTPVAVDAISPDPGPYSEDKSAVTAESELLFPSSLAWEGKLMSMFRTCISPHIFSRASWNEPFSIWARVLLDSPLSENEREGITRTDKLFGLETVLDSARVTSWAYPSLDGDFVRTLESAIEELTTNEPYCDDVSSASFSPLPRATTAVSMPTLKEVVEGIPHGRVSDVFFGGNGGDGLGTEGTGDDFNAIEELSFDLRSVANNGPSARNTLTVADPSAHPSFAECWQFGAGPAATKSPSFGLPSDPSTHVQPPYMTPEFGAFASSMGPEAAFYTGSAPNPPTLNQCSSTSTVPISLYSPNSVPSTESASRVSENVGQQSTIAYGTQSYDEQYQQLQCLPRSYVPQHVHPVTMPPTFPTLMSTPAFTPIAYDELASELSVQHTMTAAELEAEFQRLFGKELKYGAELELLVNQNV